MNRDNLTTPDTRRHQVQLIPSHTSKLLLDRGSKLTSQTPGPRQLLASRKREKTRRGGQTRRSKQLRHHGHVSGAKDEFLQSCGEPENRTHADREEEKKRDVIVIKSTTTAAATTTTTTAFLRNKPQPLTHARPPVQSISPPVQQAAAPASQQCNNPRGPQASGPQDGGGQRGTPETPGQARLPAQYSPMSRRHMPQAQAQAQPPGSSA
ncbi:hypothetical protein GGR54DRAFT_5501 [Hypoxylon sp. NC1633]|nr:hypothetical protein GGR54DRAFT_5501 [Hypoxylon sp. NC1633]